MSDISRPVENSFVDMHYQLHLRAIACCVEATISPVLRPRRLKLSEIHEGQLQWHFLKIHLAEKKVMIYLT